MIKVNYTEWGLKHSFRRHHIEKGTIQRAISRGIRSIVEDPNNNSIIIFTTSKLAVAVDHKNNMKTAFWYRPNYYTSKMYSGQIIETNMINNEAYTILTNKEWSIVKDGDDYIVTLNGTITYLISMPVQTNFTISSDMYITYIEMYVAGECTQFETVEKNPNSKLDI